jgi:hypothetical protein
MSGVKVNNGVVNYGGLPSGGSGLLAARPAAGVVGRIFIASDTLLLYRDTGSGWATIGGTGTVTGSGAAGQAAFWTGASAISGDNAFFWDNTNKRLGLNTATPGVRLDIHGTGVLQQLNGTTTNSAFLDFQNAGTTQFRIGNDYNAGANTFNIFNNSLSDYSFAVVKSSGLTIFGSSTYNLFSSTYKFSFVNTNASMESIRAIYSYKNSSSGIGEYYFTTRGTSVGSFSATLSADTLLLFSVNGSTNTNFCNAGEMAFRQNGSIGTSAPTDIEFAQYGSTNSRVIRLKMFSAGYSTFLDRVNVNNATDNSLFELNNNGNFYTGGLSPTILTVAVNTTMARTVTGYYCTASITLTLPSAASLNNVYWIIAASGVTVTVNRAGSDDILNLAGASVTTISVTSNQRAMFYVGGGTRTFLISQS